MLEDHKQKYEAALKECYNKLATVGTGSKDAVELSRQIARLREAVKAIDYANEVLK